MAYFVSLQDVWGNEDAESLDQKLSKNQERLTHRNDIGVMNEDILDSENIMLDGRPEAIPIPKRTRDTVLRPLCEWICTLRKDVTIKANDERLLIGIVGAGGSGKTILSQLLSTLFNNEFGVDFAKVLSMDAYHLPNETLCNNSWPRYPTLTLKDGKGFPETLDIDAFVSDLDNIRQSKLGFEVQLPIYDRRLHEPVQNQLTLEGKTEVVFVEGLHLLFPEGKWGRVRELLHGTIALNCSEKLRRERVVTRKVSNGRSFESSSKHFDLVDEPIALRIEKETQLADVELFLGTEPLQIISARVKQQNPSFALTEEFKAKNQHSKNLLVFGLNPALQKRLEFSASPLTLGVVNRASTLESGIGGKGQNVCTAVDCLENALLSVSEHNKKMFNVTVAQFLGGQTGEIVRNMMNSMGVSFLPSELHTEQPTRVCTTLLDTLTGDTTEIVEPCGAITLSEQEVLLSSFGSTYCPSLGIHGLHGVAVMGSLPTNVEQDFYAKALMEIMQNDCYGPGTKILVDSVHGIPELFKCCNLDLLKLNAAELAKLAKVDFGSTSESVIGIPFDIIKTSALKLFKNNRLQYIAVTDGGKAAYLFQNPFTCIEVEGSPECHFLVSKYWRYRLPSFDEMERDTTKIYPIGAGDTVSAVTLSYWVSGFDLTNAFLFGLAAASASCLCPSNAEFSLDQMEKLSRSIQFDMHIEAICLDK